jgi:ribosomal protein S18 acetylase RimI-like enzyme
MTIEVRVALPDEYERVGELTISAYELLAVGHLWGGYDTEILDTATRAKSAEVLVAVDNGTIVGSVTYVDDHSSPWSEWTKPGEAQFRLLAVAAQARGRGVGAALARACMRSEPLLIHTTPWMDAARRLYGRLGFVRRPERDVPYEVWNASGIDGLPREWIRQAFLAYGWRRTQ